MNAKDKFKKKDHDLFQGYLSRGIIGEACPLLGGAFDETRLD